MKRTILLGAGAVSLAAILAAAAFAVAERRKT
jgi:hypothetical protein